MESAQAKEQLKDQLEDYLRSLGINTRKPFSCLQPDHEDRKPSMSLNRKENKVKCFGCGFSGDIFDLIGLDYDLTEFKDQFKKACELYNIEIEYKPGQKQSENKNNENKKHSQSVGKSDYTEYITKCEQELKDNPEALQYLQDRGLSEDNWKRFRVGYDDKKSLIVFPYSRKNNYYIARSLITKGHYKPSTEEAGAEPIFNQYALYDTGEPVFVCEGVFDALSIAEAGAEAIAIGGVGHNKLIYAIKDKKPLSTLILALDNDETGNNATEKLSKELKSLGISHIIANFDVPYKDPNEYLQEDKKSFKMAIKGILEQVKTEMEQNTELERVEYEKSNAYNHIDGFLKKIKEGKKSSVSTGFEVLDKVLDGGLHEGLYILGAISSLGKTTFTMQIADQIAQQDEDVLIFSLEMATHEIMAKSISRITLQESNSQSEAKTTREIMSADMHQYFTTAGKELVNHSITQYSTFAKNLYIHEGMGNIGAVQIREIIEKHINLTGKKPIVIIDYLQILAPFSERMTDKQNTDKSVMELKRMSRDFKIPVVGISSLNRDSYTSKISMKAFKESGAIEYSSDVLIGLQLQMEESEISETAINEAKSENIRKIELIILKNRNGRTGVCVNYDYVPKFNYYSEVGKVESKPGEFKRITKKSGRI